MFAVRSRRPDNPCPARVYALRAAYVLPPPGDTGADAGAGARPPSRSVRRQLGAAKASAAAAAEAAAAAAAAAATAAPYVDEYAPGYGDGPPGLVPVWHDAAQAPLARLAFPVSSDMAAAVPPAIVPLLLGAPPARAAPPARPLPAPPTSVALFHMGVSLGGAAAAAGLLPAPLSAVAPFVLEAAEAVARLQLLRLVHFRATPFAGVTLRCLGAPWPVMRGAVHPAAPGAAAVAARLDTGPSVEPQPSGGSGCRGRFGLSFGDSGALVQCEPGQANVGLVPAVAGAVCEGAALGGAERTWAPEVLSALKRETTVRCEGQGVFSVGTLGYHLATGAHQCDPYSFAVSYYSPPETAPLPPALAPEAAALLIGAVVCDLRVRTPAAGLRDAAVAAVAASEPLSLARDLAAACRDVRDAAEAVVDQRRSAAARRSSGGDEIDSDDGGAAPADAAASRDAAGRLRGAFMRVCLAATAVCACVRVNAALAVPLRRFSRAQLVQDEGAAAASTAGRGAGGGGAAAGPAAAGPAAAGRGVARKDAPAPQPRLGASSAGPVDGGAGLGAAAAPGAARKGPGGGDTAGSGSGAKRGPGDAAGAARPGGGGRPLLPPLAGKSAAVCLYAFAYVGICISKIRRRRRRRRAARGRPPPSRARCCARSAGRCRLAARAARRVHPSMSAPLGFYAPECARRSRRAWTRRQRRR